MDSLNIVFTGKSQVEVRREPVPKLEKGQVLVRTRKTLISTGTECICFQRNFAEGTHWSQWVKYPFYPGYSNAGEVIEVGSDVTSLKVGDRVACRRPHKQYFPTDASAAMTIPDGVSDEDATWFGLANIVQNGVRKAEHELGDAVVVIGLGLLGQLVVQYARLAGAREVIAIDTARARLDMAKAHGATQTLEMTVAEASQAMADLTEGRLADVVYDVTGHAAVFSPALGLARRFGKLLLLGDTGNPAEQRLTPDVIRRGIHIIGAHDNDRPRELTEHLFWSYPNMTKLFFKYLERGQMRVKDLVTHRYRPEEAPAAYGMLTTDRSKAMGVIFEFQS